MDSLKPRPSPANLPKLPQLKYRIIKGGDPEELEIKVNAAMMEGYMPHGGIFLYTRATRIGFEFYQAVILKDPSAANPPG